MQQTRAKGFELVHSLCLDDRDLTILKLVESLVESVEFPLTMQIIPWFSTLLVEKGELRSFPQPALSQDPV
jgi:hypothetical protein